MLVKRLLHVDEEICRRTDEEFVYFILSLVNTDRKDFVLSRGKYDKSASVDFLIFVFPSDSDKTFVEII